MIWSQGGITLAEALREIDRMSLNALVLVKRQGNALAGYGVVAQAFRERAAFLKEAAHEMQSYVSPLIQTQLHVLKYTRMADSYARQVKHVNTTNCPSLECTYKQWKQNAATKEAEAHRLLQHLLHAVVRVEEGINEQEYVVVNGRIEAALSEGIGVPLARVSDEMGVAVEKVHQAISDYRYQLEEFYDENSADI
ncbi:hypothetical protein [Acidithiobacillus thiooxidans]|uniref:hypothetical protein n=1 Tax=Acidithiobacillus thiooxidans TaxID=930 RepID=UPI0009D97221|nr:hypothetical protein [Acidithiobacillus thiooxidans]